MHTHVDQHHVAALDSTMAYREVGASGRAVALFLHGNPTSSFIWRNIMPLVTRGALHRARPDRLWAVGKAGYRVSLLRSRAIPRCIHRSPPHRSVLSRGPGLGNGPGFSLRRAAPRAGARPRLHGVHSADAELGGFSPVTRCAHVPQIPNAGRGRGDDFLESNAFIERVLPGSIKRKLSDEEMAAYRNPFLTPESRRPIWRLPNELPIGGEPADVHAALEAAHAALAAADYPKLLFVGDPGALGPAGLCRALRRFGQELPGCPAGTRFALSAGRSRRDHRPVDR